MRLGTGSVGGTGRAMVVTLCHPGVLPPPWPFSVAPTSPAPLLLLHVFLNGFFFLSFCFFVVFVVVELFVTVVLVVSEVVGGEVGCLGLVRVWAR